MRDAELRFGTLRLRIEERTPDRARRGPRDDGVVSCATRATRGSRRAARRRRRAGRIRGLDLRRRARPDLFERPRPGHPATDPQPAARAGRPRLPGPVPRLRADHGAADRDPARDVRPPGRLLPERARDRPLHGHRHGRRRPVARRSCSSATTRGRPSWPATGRTSTSRSRSIARRRHPPPGRDDRRRRSPATPRSTELQPGRPAAADGLRLRLPDRDDDALLSRPGSSVGPSTIGHRTGGPTMSDHDAGHATKHRRLLELEEMVRDGQIDTIVVAITDMQGRLVGKRVQGQAFLDGVISHGAHFCTYLLGTDMEMTTPEGFKLMNWETGYGDWVAEPVWDQLRVLPWLPGTAMVLADAIDEETGLEIPIAPADDPQAPGRAGGGGRLHAQGRLGVRVLRPEGLLGGPGRPRLAGAPPVRSLQRGLPPPPGDQGRTAAPAPAQPDDRGGRADRVQQGRGGQRPARGQHPLRPRPRSRPTGASSSSTAPRRSPTSTAGASRSWPSRTITGPAHPGTST